MIFVHDHGAFVVFVAEVDCFPKFRSRWVVLLTETGRQWGWWIENGVAVNAGSVGGQSIHFHRQDARVKKVFGG